MPKWDFEEFAVENAINKILRKTQVQKLMLLVNTPGGLVQSSYKNSSSTTKIIQ